MWQLLLILIFSLAASGQGLICTRLPANTDKEKLRVDENYAISITDNPETYILGQKYNVSLNAFNNRRYIGYILALEAENGDSVEDLGQFELQDTVDARFRPNCVNMVENRNANPTSHMHLTWIAPTTSNVGCILIRATILQQRDVWFMDDGGLTFRICEEVVDDMESQPLGGSLDSPCCACDEARYELSFERIWSRNLHPKSYPDRIWQTRFCDLVGATHSSDYRFWEIGTIASEALKNYAEQCSSEDLEEEFKQNFNDQKIRTIIKARGPSFPNLNSVSAASVRADPVHHMLSFASTIYPSPDWIVGVSGLELCLRNCTWLESKVVNLYPWDVGTDAGFEYTSSNDPQRPQQVISRSFHSGTPFHEDADTHLKPMAKLTIKRQRIYERRCTDEESNDDEGVARECFTHPWSSWSNCTTKCGAGMRYRRRVYKQPDLARVYKCSVLEYEEQACVGEVCSQGELLRNRNLNIQQADFEGSRAECQLTDWGEWGPCSVTCGEGYQSHRRQYLNPEAEFKCQNVHRFNMQEKRKCNGLYCLGNFQGETYNNNDDRNFMDRNRANDEPETFDGELEVGNLRRDQEQISYPYTNRRMPNSNKYYRSLDDSNNQDAQTNGNNYMAQKCFEMLSSSQTNCWNQTTVGNFWFYNFCADVCMLFAADVCDRNVNKFRRWEDCDSQCRRPEFQQIQQRYANTQECVNLLAEHRAQQRSSYVQRSYSSRRRNQGNQQWG